MPIGISAKPCDAYDLLLVAGGPQLPFMDFGATFDGWLRGACARGAALRFDLQWRLHAGAGRIAGGAHRHHPLERCRGVGAVVSRRRRSKPIACTSQDGTLYTSAGVTAGIDLSLYLLARDHGAGSGVERGQAPGGVHPAFRWAVAVQPVPHAARRADLGGGDWCSCMCWPISTGRSDHCRSGQCGEHECAQFLRVFAREAKVTPAEFVERARVDAARVMLESTAAPLKTVAYQCGFRDAQHMRGVFNRRLGVTPQQFRLNFAVMV